jgi:hypothetical protein
VQHVVRRRRDLGQRALVALSIASACLALACGGGGGGAGEGGGAGPPARTLDLSTSPADVLRVHGSVGTGRSGVPVASGGDIDGDGFVDLGLAAMRASPLGRTEAGTVFLVFGDGTLVGPRDTAVASASVLVVHGAAANENAGSEIWIDDVTGDGLADLLIARQNFSLPGRVGAGALTIVPGGAALAAYAATLAPLDLASPPPALSVTTLVGREALGRLGIWLRTGDATGDGVADVLVGADQENAPGESDSGAAYLVRGSAALAAGGSVDLADFGTTALEGDLARIVPPPNASEFHFGATVDLSDLDGNGRAEAIVAATLNRAGAGLPASAATAAAAHARGGTTDGTVFIAWDDNFPSGAWPDGYLVALDAAPGAVSTVRGGTRNISFGEELIGGDDYDGDGRADLFVGDIVGDATDNQSRPSSGSGHVLYDASFLRNRSFSLDSPPSGLVTTTFIGPTSGGIASDTALRGDFDGDGRADLAFSSPHGNPPGRPEGGIVHIFHGQSGPWPARVDLRWGQQPSPSALRLSEVHGAKAQDVLCYSAAHGDVDGDGIDDLIVNEMLGDGLAPGVNDVGNLLVIGGTAIQALP